MSSQDGAVPGETRPSVMRGVSTPGAGRRKVNLAILVSLMVVAGSGFWFSLSYGAWNAESAVEGGPGALVNRLLADAVSGVLQPLAHDLVFLPLEEGGPSGTVSAVKADICGRTPSGKEGGKGPSTSSGPYAALSVSKGYIGGDVRRIGNFIEIRPWAAVSGTRCPLDLGRILLEQKELGAAPSAAVP